MNDLNKAIEYGSNHIDIYLSRGLIYAYNRNYELSEKDLNKFLNDSGGVYKYRWGDHELNSLFYFVHYGKRVYDFKTVDEGYHNQSVLRGIQDLAPGVKNLEI